MQFQGMEGCPFIEEVGLADHRYFLHMKFRLTTELECHSQDLEEKLFHLHKTRVIEEDQVLKS